MKMTAQCPKCQSRRVGYLRQVMDVGQHGGVRRLVAPGQGSIWRGTFLTVDTSVEAYLCVDCGYFEEYLKEPAAVDWDRVEEFTWCRPDVPEQGPFR